MLFLEYSKHCIIQSSISVLFQTFDGCRLSAVYDANSFEIVALCSRARPEHKMYLLKRLSFATTTGELWILSNYAKLELRGPYPKLSDGYPK